MFFAELSDTEATIHTTDIESFEDRDYYSDI